MWARIGSLFILSKHLGNASQVWVVGVVRARGGVGTHWQPLNTLYTPRKCEPGLCSGEETQARGGVGGGGGEGAGGCGHAVAAFKYSLNTQKMQPGVGSGEAGVVWCGR